MLIPIIAAFVTAIGVIMDKIILSRQKVGHRQFLLLIFLFLFIICLILYPIWGKINPRAFSLEYIGVLILMILIASICNVLFYHGIEKEKIAEVELIVMLSPLSTILIASLFLQTERNLHIFLAGIIASLALVASHLKQYHLSFDVFQKGLLLYLILYPFEVILTKSLLFLYSPLALYMVRTFGIFIFLFIWYLVLAPYFKGEPKPSFAKWRVKNYAWSFAIAVLAVLQMVLIYYAYVDFGVVFTTIVLTLAPIFIYLGSVVILKERLKKRIILAAVIILICIVYANLAMAR
jgi:drug/metabolite transporter (DMT)-like permease